MDKWQEVVIGNHIDLISGYAFKSGDFLENKVDGALPVIKIKNVANGDVNFNDVVYHKFDSSLEKFVLSKGDVLIAMTGNHPHAETQVVGDVSKYKLSEKALLNQRVGKLVPKGKTDLNFIYYLFKSEDVRFNLANKSSGSANQANISKGDILGLEVKLPNPTEQATISSILTSIDDKIDLLHRQNATLEKMAETLFRQWFVEEAIEDWRTYKLKDLVKHVKPGTNFQPKRIEFGIPFLNVRNLNNGFLDLSDTTKISNEEYQRIHKNWQPEENDILISRIGTLGVVAVILKKDLPVAVHYNMINLKSKITSYQFLYFLLKSQLFQEKYFLNIRQSVQEYVAIEDTENIEIQLPIENADFKSKEQVFNDLFEKIKSNVLQIQTLTKLRDSLIPKLMNGGVTINTD